ncbi:hypothetical protein T4D_10002 [Trichinella pseudospiralis]|uniref:Uncharacterized protein n=1 Tax=Trichinella pseudospiralis TaxID=6337 RepID=A0A0V1FJF5_TRIPS|nr:hypothetical protein T4D_10002 [Trichinella pseudospiralis]
MAFFLIVYILICKTMKNECFRNQKCIHFSAVRGLKHCVFIGKKNDFFNQHRESMNINNEKMAHLANYDL